MIEESTVNRKYPLPHPENRASQDVERIAAAISMIDEDINACIDSYESNEGVNRLLESALKIPKSLTGSVNTEITDIKPQSYLVVNEDASGFKTVEAGGGEGGRKGELLVKQSDNNFDVAWIDPRAITKKAFVIREAVADVVLPNNGFVILADGLEIDNSSGFARYGLTQRQIMDSENADANYSYILCDELEENFEEESDLATRESYGRVRIGDGIDVENGIISVEKPALATKTTAGLVKIGENLEIKDGKLTIGDYAHADYERFGLVKLSSDFRIDKKGALVIALKDDPIIYQNATVDAVENGVIQIRANCAKYRTYIDTDVNFKIDWSGIDMEKDLAFELEINAERTLNVSFDFDVVWEQEEFMDADPGKTTIRFLKMLGADWLNGTVL